MEKAIRVFISYSTEDKELVKKLAGIIEFGGMTALWSEKLSTGEAFDDKIKRFIEHSHVFMPVLTRSALKRGWVHQEIGYAMGLHIPIFPVTTEKNIKSGMLQILHTRKLSDDFEELKKQLHYDEFKALLDGEHLSALYLKATHVGNRAKMIKIYADNISKVSNLSQLDKHGLVRQKGGLSSFHIPKNQLEHPDWTNRYLPETKSSEHKELQLSERKALQNHADVKGCRLIISPHYATLGRSEIAANTRINNLIEFLESMPDQKVVIAIRKTATEISSLTMVGDWFLAESVSYKDGDGFTHTFFTRNATEINNRIDNFEDELSDLLAELKWTEENSRDHAVEYLKGLMKE